MSLKTNWFKGAPAGLKFATFITPMYKRLYLLSFLAIISIKANSQFFASPAVIAVIPAGAGAQNVQLNCSTPVLQGNTENPGNTDTVTAVGEIARQGESGLQLLTVYPNPASDNLWVRLQLQGPAAGQLLVSDITGRKLNEVKLPQRDYTDWKEQINMSGYESGMYFITASFITANSEETHTFSQKIRLIR
jgi:hypothetical protein